MCKHTQASSRVEGYAQVSLKLALVAERESSHSGVYFELTHESKKKMHNHFP